MATTYDASVASVERQNTGQGVARRMFNRFIEAQQKEANRRIAHYLQGLDARTLADLGYTNAQIEQLLGKRRSH